jgi:hypothetical protein
MSLRYRRVLPLVAACLALTVAAAFASKPEPTLIPTEGPLPVVMNSITGTTTACEMGILPPPALAFGYILPPADQYFTLLNPANCASCGANPARLITMSHTLLYFTEPCQIPVTVAIAPAFETSPGCYTPNPFAANLCPPVQYMVSDGGNLGACVDAALPVAAACCVDGPTFLMIQYDQGTCANGRPAFCGPGSCSLCQQYNFYPGAGFPGDDLCALLGPQGVFGVNMWVDSECCQPTSTLPGSWGSLKSLYR